MFTQLEKSLEKAKLEVDSIRICLDRAYVPVDLVIESGNKRNIRVAIDECQETLESHLGISSDVDRIIRLVTDQVFDALRRAATAALNVEALEDSVLEEFMHDKS